MPKKKKQPSTPRRKRLTQRGRLAAAPAWLAGGKGQSLVLGPVGGC